MAALDRIRLIDAAKRGARAPRFACYNARRYKTMRPLAEPEKFLGSSVLLLIALVAVFFLPFSWVSIAQAKALFITVTVVVVLCVWLVISFRDSNVTLPRHPLLAASALIPVAYLVSALATGASRDALIGDGTGQDTVLRFALLSTMLMLTAIVLGAKYGRLVFALRLLVLGSLGILFVQIGHIFVPALNFGGVLSTPTSSIVGSWHDLGIFLGLMAFLSCVLAPRASVRGPWRYVLVLNGALAAALLLAMNFSDVWLGVMFLCSLYLLFIYQRDPIGPGVFTTREFQAWALAGILALGFFVGGDMLQARLPAPLQVTQVEVRPSWQGTFSVGRELFATPGKVFFGSGPSTFSREWGLYKPLSVNTTQFWNTDFYYGVGFIPTSLVTTGILGFLAWSAVGVALLWSVWRWFKEISSQSVIRTALVGGALYLTTFHLLYTPGPAVSFLTFVVLGMLVAEALHRNPARTWVAPISFGTWGGRATIVVVSLVSFLLLLGGIQSIRTVASDIYVNRAVVAYTGTQDVEHASRSVASAIRILPSNDRAHRAAVELGLLQLSKMASEDTESEATRNMLQETLTATIQHGLMAVSIEGRDYQNWLSLARLYAELAGVGVEGAERSARDAYAEVRENNPTSPLPYIGEAQLDLAVGNETSARKNLEAAVSLKPDHAAARFLLSQIFARMNDMAAAKEHAAAVVAIAPQDPLGWYNLGTIFYAQGDHGSAISAFERAVGIQHNYANALYLLGLSYHRLGRSAEALTALRTVAALNPEDGALAALIEDIEVEITADSSL